MTTNEDLLTNQFCFCRVTLLGEVGSWGRENHLPFKFFVALDLLFKVIEGRAGQN